MSKRPIYVSIDVEADGPIPGRNNMLSFGAAAFDLDLDSPTPRKPIGTFETNLELLPEATPSEDTMKWWATQPEAWATCRKNLQPVDVAMPAFIAWIRWLGRKAVIVGYPVTYDFMFLYWYTMAFGGLEDGVRCPYGFQGFDIKTAAAVKLGVDFPRASKRNMPKHWFRGSPKHNHEALTDAIGQGVMFVNMMNDG